MAKIGDKFLGFEFDDADTDGSEAAGYASQMRKQVGVIQTIVDVASNSIYTDTGWWYPSDNTKFKIIGEKVKKEKQVKDIKLKGNVYAVVVDKNILEISNTREQARKIKNDYISHNPSESFKIVKMIPYSFVR